MTSRRSRSGWPAKGAGDEQRGAPDEPSSGASPRERPGTRDFAFPESDGQLSLVPHGGARGVASRWLLALALAGSALAVGAVHATVLVVVAATLAASFVLSWGAPGAFRTRRPATLIFILAAGLFVFTALQAVPMPEDWLRAFAPNNADVWSRALAPLREPGPTAAPISLDPPATYLEILRGACYLAAFLVALRVASRRRGVIFLEAVIVGAGVVVGVAALLHPTFGFEKVFGIYRPGPGIEPRHVAPLLNANHLAEYLNIAFCLALAMAITRQPDIPRLVPIAAAAVLVPIQLWVASRGGVATMAVGALLVLGLSLRGAASRPKLASGLAAGVLAVAGGGMIVLSTSREALHELTDTDVSKLDIFRQAMDMVPKSPLFGVGRGAFEGVFPAFKTMVGHGDHTHPENIVAQLTVEWGVPVAAITFVVLAIALRPTVALARSRPAVGPWAAIVVVALQNLVDFGSEVPAIVLALTACAAMCVSGNQEGARRRKLNQWGARPRVVLAFGLVALIAGVAVVIPTLGHDITRDRRDLYAAAMTAGEPAEAFHDLARRAMLRHPAEPYFAFAGAIRASREKDESILPWIPRGRSSGRRFTGRLTCFSRGASPGGGPRRRASSIGWRWSSSPGSRSGQPRRPRASSAASTTQWRSCPKARARTPWCSRSSPNRSPFDCRRRGSSSTKSSCGARPGPGSRMSAGWATSSSPSRRVTLRRGAWRSGRSASPRESASPRASASRCPRAATATRCSPASSWPRESRGAPSR